MAKKSKGKETGSFPGFCVEGVATTLLAVVVKKLTSLHGPKRWDKEPAETMLELCHDLETAFCLMPATEEKPDSRRLHKAEDPQVMALFAEPLEKPKPQMCSSCEEVPGKHTLADGKRKLCDDCKEDEARNCVDCALLFNYQDLNDDDRCGKCVTVLEKQKAAEAVTKERGEWPVANEQGHFCDYEPDYVFEREARIGKKAAEMGASLRVETLQVSPNEWAGMYICQTSTETYASQCVRLNTKALLTSNEALRYQLDSAKIWFQQKEFSDLAKPVKGAVKTMLGHIQDELDRLKDAPEPEPAWQLRRKAEMANRVIEVIEEKDGGFLSVDPEALASIVHLDSSRLIEYGTITGTFDLQLLEAKLSDSVHVGISTVRCCVTSVWAIDNEIRSIDAWEVVPQEEWEGEVVKYEDRPEKGFRGVLVNLNGENLIIAGPDYTIVPHETKAAEPEPQDTGETESTAPDLDPEEATAGVND